MDRRVRMPKLKSITYKPKGAADDPTRIGYFRVPLAEAMLIEGYGIENDRKGGNPNRNLNVMDDFTLAELAEEGYPTGPGALGENLILSGLDLRTLPEGAALRIGSEAAIELGRLREPCEQLTILDERMPHSVEDRVGRMCQVVRSGRIKVGDRVELIMEDMAENQ